MDTGSTVSTVSEDFYKQHLHHLELFPITDILKIECADGEHLPYYGYIEAHVTTNGVPSTSDQPTHYPILVVPNSNYNGHVPVLLGTNVLQHMLDSVKNNYGNKFLQDAKLYTPWYLAFRGMTLREKELTRNHHRLGIVKSAETQSIVIPPNSSVTVSGYVDKALPYQPTTAVLQATANSMIPSDLDIVPALVDYRYPANHLIRVDIDNITTRTVRIQPRAILCELHPVVIEEDYDVSISQSAQPSKNVLDLVTIEDDISHTEEQLGKQLILDYDDVFSKGDTDIGHTDIVRHRIDLHDDHPFKQRPRNIPPSMFNEVKEHLKQLMDGGIIRKSKSPWSSNVVLCRKKNNELRMCVDFRQLNLRTKKDSYALPRIEDILNALSGNKYFTILDMKSGYHQIELLEQHKERTAFTVGPLGFYEYHRMPFGLVNAPATYQRLMEECFEGLHLDICYIYLDDLIIFSKTFEEHLERLEKIFKRLREINLKLSPKKCEFFKRKVKYVGNIVSEHGIEPDPDKIDKVQNWPTPTNPDEVRRFLGFVGYYRRFIEGFSTIARPLNDLMPDSKKKARKGSKPKPPPPNWHWGPEQEASFKTLKEKLVTYPILGFADYALPFEIHTDASTSSLGAVLYQEQDNVKRVIAYASRSLSKSEKNYPVHKLEFLALKWAICEKFRDYLYGGMPFIAYTDNNPLTYVLSSAKLDACSQRWIADLATFNFSIVYKPGSQNLDADALSRIPSQDTCTIPTESIKAICNATQVPYIHCLSMSAETLDNMPHLPDYTEVDIRRHQYNDPVLRFWFPYVRDNYKPMKQHLPFSYPQHHSQLYRNFDKLRIRNGVLMRETTVDDTKKLQIVLPYSCMNMVLHQLHTDMGHPGRDKTISLVRDRFYWCGMTADIENFISRCKRCTLRKTPTNQRAPLINIKTFQPLELVCVDYLTLEMSKGGYENILVITDHFTRYAQAIPTRNQTAKTTADALFHHFIVHYGIPQKLHSDQGPQFESNIIQELCKLMGISKTRTTPYHPMCNGLTEKFNSTLLKMLGTLENHQKQDWKSYVAPLVHAYNSMKQATTGQSPFFLMFGREPRLPIDLMFGTNNTTEKKNLQKYIESLKSKLQFSYNLAQESIRKSQRRQKQNYDLKVRGAVIQSGDRVLVKRVAFEGKHKLSDKWEDEPYIVHSQPNPDVPVYVVRKETNDKHQRTLHRNLLLPIGYNIEDTPVRNNEKPVPKPRKPVTRSAKKQTVSRNLQNNDSDDESDAAFEAVPIAHSNDSAAASEYSGNGDSTDTAENLNNLSHADDDHDDSSSTIPDAEDTEDAPTLQDSDEPEDSAGGMDQQARQDTDSSADEQLPSEASAGDEVQDTESSIRKSQRTRKKPQWMTGGDYVVNQQMTSTQPEWKARADYLRSLASSNVFSNVNSDVAKALLNIVTEKY